MQKNDIVMHPGQGVCKISDIREENFAGEKQTYYVLSPVYAKRETTVFVPVENSKVQIRKILTKDEIMALIETAAKSPDAKWDNNDKTRRQNFTETLKQGSLLQMMQMIAAIWKHKKSLHGSGKKLHASDEHIMESAENILYQEFAYVLGIEPSEVAKFIVEHIEKK